MSGAPRWYVVHRYGERPGLALSPPFRSLEEAWKARGGDASALGVISTEWMMGEPFAGEPSPTPSGEKE